MNDADIECEIAMFQDEWGSATCALQRQTRNAFLRSVRRRKTGFPEIQRFVNKSYTVGVDIPLGADLTHDADVGFAIGFERAENQFLIGNEFMRGQKAGAMQADDDGFGFFGEHPAFGIAADEEDGNRDSKASASTDLLVRHLGNLGKGPRVYPQSTLAKNKTTAKKM